MQIGQIVQEQAYDFVRILERDLENIRTEAQVLRRNEFLEPDIDPICSFVVQDGKTTNLVFPTLADPRLGANSDIVNVEYELQSMDTSLVYLGEELEIYTINRYLRPGDSSIRIPDGSSGAFITHFAVTMHSEGIGGVEISGTASTGDCPPDGSLEKTHIEIQAALPTLDYVSGNQRSTSNLNVTRFGATVYSPNR